MPDILQAYVSEQCKFLLRRQKSCRQWTQCIGTGASKKTPLSQVGEYGVKQAPFDVNMPTDRQCRKVHSDLIMTFLSENNV